MIGEEKTFHVTVHEAMLLTDYISQTTNVCHSTGMGKKLTELLYANINQMDELCFETYFNMDSLSFEQVNRYLISDKRPDCWCAMNCSDEGWNWCRITGASGSDELNNSGEVTYDCQLFSLSYALYSEIASGREVRSYDDYEGENVLEELQDTMFFCGDYGCAFEEDYTEEGIVSVDKGNYARLVVCGARYIDCILSGEKPSGSLVNRLDSLHEAVYPCMIVSGREYYDSFFKDLEKYGFEDESFGVVLPFLADVLFGFKMDSETESTPVLFVFQSKTMKQYQELREQYPNNRYVPYLDKLMVLLEDPIAVKRFAQSECCYETEVLGMLYSEAFASYYGYLKDCYLGVYYYYDTTFSDHNGIAFSPFFKLSRQLFEFLFQEMKNDVALKAA